MEQINSLQLVGQDVEFKFESEFKPLPLIWQSLLKAVPEDNQRFLTAKSMAELLGQSSRTAWEGWTGPQGVSKSAEVAVGSNRLISRKGATTLAILT